MHWPIPLEWLCAGNLDLVEHEAQRARRVRKQGAVAEEFAPVAQALFRDRIVSGPGRHIRAFAAEVLGAVHVLAMFVHSMLKLNGILQEHVECFEY